MMTDYTKIKEAATEYTKFLMKELEKMYGKQYKSPMMLPSKEKKKFFEHIDKKWKGKDE